MRTEDVICYLPIEVKAREFDTKLYLALRLIQKGFSVVLGRKTNLNKHMFSQKAPFIYIDKGISAGSLDFYKAIKSVNGSLVEIQEEGNIRLDSGILIRIHNNLSANLFSLIFAWSLRAKEVIENKCPKLNNSDVNVIASGHPSFDMLHEDLIGYFQKMRRSKSKIDPGYILVNTNFSKVNGIINFNEMRLYNIRDKEFHVKEDQIKFEEGKKIEKFIFADFIKMIKSLSKSFIDKIIVVRPHPMENKEFYEDEFREYDNIKVIADGSSKEWIVDAETIIHHDCTTGVEAFLAKKRVISFSPYKDNDHIIKLPQDISIKFDNVNNIINFLKKGDKDNLSEIKNKNLKLLELTNNINIEKEKAADVIVLNLVKLCQSIKNKKPMFLKKKYYLGKVRILNLIERIMQRKNNSLLTMRKAKFAYLKKEELEERLNIWYNHLLIKDDIEVNELNSDIFLLKKK